MSPTQETGMGSNLPMDDLRTKRETMAKEGQFSRWLRVGLIALVAALAFRLSGDGGVVAAVATGIDPLEVLDLEVRPNVMIILDTSGSMNDTPDTDENTGPFWKPGGDWPPPAVLSTANPLIAGGRGSKIAQGKFTLINMINANQTRASFSFGQYTQTDQMLNLNEGNNRFAYYTTSTIIGAQVPAVTIPVPPPLPGPNVRAIYAFQNIQAVGAPGVTNNTLYYTEAGRACTVLIPTKFYAEQPPNVAGTTLANQIATSMNACPGRPGAPPNTYSVTYVEASGQFTFRVASGGNAATLNWSNPAGSIGPVLAAGTTDRAIPFTTGDARINTLRTLTSGGGFTYPFTSNWGPATPPGTLTPETTYGLMAGLEWNQQTFYVLASGIVCGMAPNSVGAYTDPVGIAGPNPPRIALQLVTNCATPTTSTSGGPIIMYWGGGAPDVTGNFVAGFGFNGIGCNGYKNLVSLAPCTNNNQAATLETPYLQPAVKLDANGNVVNQNAAGTITYAEKTDGTGSVVGCPGACPNLQAFGLPADGSTPIGFAIRDFKTVFNFYYTGGGNPGPPVGPLVLPSGPINTHLVPRENTIMIFVTDGDDTCEPGSLDQESWASAFQAELLYDPIGFPLPNADGTLQAGTDPAASVQTYMIGFGSSTNGARLNAISWGGSGLSQNNHNPWNNFPTAAQRANCVTCHDAFVAPTAQDLANAIQSILDQGATTGSFQPQQSITDSVFEYTKDVVPIVPNPPGFYGPNDPQDRYKAIVPILFQAAFDLPGFVGHLKAFECCDLGGNAIQKWDAGPTLLTRVTNEFLAIAPIRTGAVAGQGTFPQVVGAIDRRIYTTGQNGTFSPTLANLLVNVSPGRVNLWPPTAAVAPADYVTQGSLDAALGLPPDTIPVAQQAAALAILQAAPFYACTGANAPGSPGAAFCTSAVPLTKLKAARREAREAILGWAAGAQQVVNNAALKRVTSGTDNQMPLFAARAFVLADSTLASPAVVGPPDATPPAGPLGVTEWSYYAHGFKSTSAPVNVQQELDISQGFGLLDADLDANAPVAGVDRVTNPTLRPVMTVVYAGANDMLHAFRAGPNCDVPGGGNNLYLACADHGGEELWGFVPFDSLGQLQTLLTPQKRATKSYVIASSVRFADVFVPAPAGTTVSEGSLGAVPLQGVWRKVILFGRGIGGKYYTALDVTVPGNFNTLHTATNGPIVLWNRGNPDTVDGTPGGPVTNNATDAAYYSSMGETWSLPAIGLLGSPLGTARHPLLPSPGGVSFVAYMGSGYGNYTAGCSAVPPNFPPASPCEGTTFYTVDVLTGDIIGDGGTPAAVDVNGPAAPAILARSGIAFPNALVADPAGFNPSQFTELATPANLSGTATERAYIGDLYGRLWKFLAADPTKVEPVADLGIDQPVATPAALIGILPTLGPKIPQPYIYVESGNETRQPDTTTFKYFGFQDIGDKADTTQGSEVGTTDAAVFVFKNNINFLFDGQFPTAFRGTIQPATAFNTLGGTSQGQGRVFFAGTRFNPPGSTFAPPVPPYPCRSSFDSVVFGLGAVSGLGAFNLSTGPNTAMIVISGVRMTGISISTDATPGNMSGTRVNLDFGKAGGLPNPPPPPGINPNTGGAPAILSTLPAGSGANSFPGATFVTVCQ
jgi:hypothetical protein